MASWGTPGESATEGYRSAVRGRRRSRALRWGVIAGALAAAWLVFRWSHGEGRLVTEGLLALVLGCTAVWRPESDTRRWLRGADGEVATASLLDELPAKRWKVFHDLAVPGSRSNIDHLAVGPTGVWVIDSKATRGSVEVRMFSVRLGERRLDTAPVRWQAAVVGDRLGVRVRPVIAIHCEPAEGGTGLRRRGVRRGGVAIVAAGDLPRRLRRGRRRFRRGDVEALAGEVLAHFRPGAASASQNWARD